MSQLIYVETSIPSFYYELRAATDMVARREWTREWWERAKTRDELVTSAPVLDELKQGAFPGREECLRLLEDEGAPLRHVVGERRKG